MRLLAVGRHAGPLSFLCLLQRAHSKSKVKVYGPYRKGRKVVVNLYCNPLVQCTLVRVARALAMRGRISQESETVYV